MESRNQTEEYEGCTACNASKKAKIGLGKCIKVKNHYCAFKLKLSKAYERVKIKPCAFHQYCKFVLICNTVNQLLISLLPLNIAIN